MRDVRVRAYAGREKHTTSEHLCEIQNAKIKDNKIIS